MSSHGTRPASSIIAAIARPVVALLRSILERPALLWGLLVPLSVTVIAESGELVATVPPIVPLTALFLLLAFLKGGADNILSTWRASPVAVWLYLAVCAVEVLLMLYHGSPQGWAWVAGRVTFLLVMAATAAMCGRERDVQDGLRGLTYGVGAIALLTIVHALGLVEVPTAWPLRWAGRTFGALQIPFSRTLGVRMTYNKFGVLAAAALATVLAPSPEREPLIRPSWLRAALFAATLAAAVLSQTRGVYLTVLWTLGLSLALRLVMRRRSVWLAGPAGSWLAVGTYALLLVLGNVLVVSVAPQWLIDVGYAASVDNVFRRMELNAEGWSVLKDAPLLGVGHGTFALLTRRGQNIHNHFWEHVVSTGIVGGVPYLLFHMLILVRALQLLGSPRPSVRAFAFAFAVSVSGTYLAYQFSLSFFTSVFAVLCGLLLSLEREQGRQSTAPEQRTT
jgi:hypothetical protein